MKRKVGLLLSLLLLVSCDNHKPTKLIILLVGDQMRPDHLSRFESLYTGGFKWLLENSVVFDSAYQQHGYTVTGPGHFAIGTGIYPGPGGVLGNEYFDRDLGRVVNCVEDPKAHPVGGEGSARSIRRYKTKGIGDMLKDADPKSKVFSIGGKDRAAIFLGGQNPDLALYYNNRDRFISSTFYRDFLPEWVNEYNDNMNLKAYKDSVWNKIFPDSYYIKYSRQDYFNGEVDFYHDDKHDLNDNTDKKKNIYNPVFPISFDKGVDPGKEFLDTPWFDEKLFGLSEITIEKAELGSDNHPDLLCIGISTMDYILHNYGPFSQEAMDYFLRLDLVLGRFIDYLDHQVGLENIEFILSSDHGGLPIPEYLPSLGMEGGRVSRRHLKEAYEWINDEISEMYGDNLFVRSGVRFYFNHERLRKNNISFDKPAQVIKKYLLKVDGISAVLTKDEILTSKEKNAITIRLKNMIHPEKSADVFALIKEGYLYRSTYGTSHGSPYDYDTHVPLLFAREGRKYHHINHHAETVDIVPTILDILNIQTEINLHGKILPIK